MKKKEKKAKKQKYYQDNKERLQEMAGDGYKTLSKKKKIGKENTQKINTGIYLKKISKN